MKNPPYESRTELAKAGSLVRGVIEAHIGRKNAMSHGIGETCGCDECKALLRALKEMGFTDLEWDGKAWKYPTGVVR